jgi:hypothetical protein
VVYPRDTWWVKIEIAIENLIYKIRRTPFRMFVHSPKAIVAVVCDNGLKQRFHLKTGMWQVAVYARKKPPLESSSTEGAPHQARKHA